MKISIALATFNEEKNLKNCLESIKDLAGEIVVVDGGSSDKTVKIAQDYGARVIVTSNPPIFHINKQKAIDACSSDWILQLDADERVTPELAKEIRVTIEQSSNRAINGFWIPRKNWFLGRFLTKGGQYPDYTLRLYRQGKGHLPCKSVHEQAEVTGKVDYLKNPLIHMADVNFNQYLKRWNRYNDLLADEIREKLTNRTAIGKIIDFYFYNCIKPGWWFILTYFRHKGFVDGWQGFVFSLFSSLKFPVAYYKYLRGKR